jgi:hypothetical protein
VKPNDEQVTTLGILLAGYLQRQHEARRELWDGNADILCRWPLTPLGVEAGNPSLPELGS